jgi:hypothetical protein
MHEFIYIKNQKKMSPKLFYYKSRFHISETEWLPNFRLLPLDRSTPIIEAYFLPLSKSLAVVLDHKREDYKLIPVIDNNGDKVMNKSTGKAKLMRVKSEDNYEHYITGDEIEKFLNLNVINIEGIDFEELRKTLAPEKEVEEEKVESELEVSEG